MAEEEKNVYSIEGEKRKRIRKNVSDKYYHLSEEEMQSLILKAKAGEDRAKTELLKVFDNFIQKYCALLFRGKYDLHDYDVRRFISLFIPDKNSAVRLRRNQINGSTYKAVNECMHGINFMVVRYADELEVRHTVQLTFLQCVNKYERRGSIPFSGFLYNYFCYVLEKNVEEYLIYQNGRNSFPLHTDDSVSSSFTDSDNYKAPEGSFMTPSIEDLFGPEVIDEYWVMGETSSFPFDRLSVHQRQLIKWRFVDGLRASHIAEKVTEHPNTLRAQLQSIKEELFSILENESDGLVAFMSH